MANPMTMTRMMRRLCVAALMLAFLPAPVEADVAQPVNGCALPPNGQASASGDVLTNTCSYVALTTEQEWYTATLNSWDVAVTRRVLNSGHWTTMTVFHEHGEPMTGASSGNTATQTHGQIATKPGDRVTVTMGYDCPGTCGSFGVVIVGERTVP